METAQRKQVIVFSTAYLPLKGGAEIAVYETTRRLTSLDFIVLTARFSRKLPKYEVKGNVRVIRLGGGFGVDKFFLPILTFIEGWKLLRKEPKDSLLWGVMISYAAIGAYFLKLVCRRIPFLLTLQEGDSEVHIKRGRLGIIGIAWKAVLNKANEVQAISTYLGFLATSYGFRKEVHVIPNGVDCEQFSREVSEKEKRFIKKELEIVAGKKVIISVSRLVTKNGIGDIIEAMKLLSDHVLLLVGEGALRKSLEEKSRELKVRDKVIFAGSVHHEKLPLYLGIADVFVRPSLSEGLGNAFLEAMAAGIPVVATPVGGIRDFVEHEETGIFVSVHSPAEIAKAVMLLDSNKNMRKKITTAARKLIKEKYDWNDVAKGMQHVFDKL
ncbi:MAG: hypothetical protein A3C80_00340 [Candidatus Ryanbacteria bacterium RIFCSPHIGHO2_02_FULL_45_43]|uniref:Glycosyl transferase family 1 domain-containing protein n=1 Tax=Candidatus Ryanbacteria bacterium RIFCSPHIGHO2_01_45_13 TaxID=1802112 RepID=A0A1G2FXE0_9BACT|nr:MAG: hypothetical protein A2718_01730 [Candidatus Ryanbacteria bacterium RIFCSPHIGHO2_01_FULL_44_130]OGZ42746.1 MAG: hypothetical protein A2W41_03335 [Candidatus Ryanbacteria bacterium RIFCSPHIGHO2_01_45_13]OGZ48766.1 MAG: hypothetical protein A3C80_00340 [Candidatus Ryanbacteria bacterium RIFCSPHIGHO2_02_FULL_45_43]OGZ50798.1 MAG: hypothetical protein A3E55_02360 [Candidatus Ryanbacteria bacterium RIFCSPHIGHO2_12_FULL_44_20]OGZ52009.1 MAG: hypothetical protein A3A17_00945 [Candidatus Ryanba